MNNNNTNNRQKIRSKSGAGTDEARTATGTAAIGSKKKHKERNSRYKKRNKESREDLQKGDPIPEELISRIIKPQSLRRACRQTAAPVFPHPQLKRKSLCMMRQIADS